MKSTNQNSSMLVDTPHAFSRTLFGIRSVQTYENGGEKKIVPEQNIVCRGAVNMFYLIQYGINVVYHHLLNIASL